jgi:hypothetical protein
LEIASYKRCSRPLCSSQTTTPYHTPHTSPRKGTKPHDRRSQETRNTSPGDNRSQSRGPPVLLPQDPTVCQTLNRPFPSPHRSKTPKGIRTRRREETGGRYLLIFHP